MPFEQLIIRGATVVIGTGAPPVGPMDIVIEGDTIVRVENVGVPGMPIDPEERPELAENGHELDAEGMFVLPGKNGLTGRGKWFVLAGLVVPVFFLVLLRYWP